MRKRFQVFISSTYEDLRDERQAAVQAILKAGHIPAGMELFTAGDASQMDVIKHWIDESDIFMLILGARYGSIEPTTGKSYVELELDHAVTTKTPFFAVVLSDEGREAKVKTQGTSVLESKNEEAYRSFRDRVKSCLCAFFSSPTEVKIAVFETLPQIVNNRELVGWVSAADIESPSEVANELANISKENTQLRAENTSLRQKVDSQSNSGPAFDELFKKLLKTEATLPSAVFNTPKDQNLPLLSLAIKVSDYLARSVTNSYGTSELETFIFYNVASPLAAYGLVELGKAPINAKWQRLQLSKDGVKFFARAKIKLEEILDRSKSNAPHANESPKPNESSLPTKIPTKSSDKMHAKKTKGKSNSKK
jgi:hypothetical protein